MATLSALAFPSVMSVPHEGVPKRKHVSHPWLVWATLSQHPVASVRRVEGPQAMPRSLLLPQLHVACARREEEALALPPSLLLPQPQQHSVASTSAPRPSLRPWELAKWARAALLAQASLLATMVLDVICVAIQLNVAKQVPLLDVVIDAANVEQVLLVSLAQVET